MVKTVLESEASLRNYCEKIEEIRMDACMCQPVSAHISMCQLQLGGTSSSRKGFYTVTN
jgi:hypothetical protein